MTSTTECTDSQFIDPDQLFEDWQKLREEHGGRLFPSDAAAKLGVSEATLLRSRTTTVRLQCELENILPALEKLGRCKAITRNQEIVLETFGHYTNYKIAGQHALVLDEGIDLRIMPDQWKQALAITDESPRGVSRSVQFYDANGKAVHKAFLQEEDAEERFNELIRNLQHSEQNRNKLVTAPVFEEEEKTKTEPSADTAENLEKDWRAMTDPHQFFGLLAKHNLNRQQAYRLVPDDLARPIDAKSIPIILQAAADASCPLMLFAGNHGCIQIFTGTVHNLKEMHGWFNILDKGLHCHMRADEIAEMWLTAKPAENNRLIKSIDCFNNDGDLVLSLFGKRKPGEDQIPAWENITDSLQSI